MSPTSNLLECETLLEPDQHYPLYIAAKKYWLPEFEAHWDDEEAVTLVLLHSTSFHKETWQPTLERIFQCSSAYSRNSSRPLKIKCAWAIDCPNHGVSAAFNDDALRQAPFYRNFGCRRYADAVHRFMSAGPKFRPMFDFRSQRLVGIGHSLGGVAMTILQNLEPAFKFSSVILVEPMLSPNAEAVEPLRRFLIKNAYERRDVWPSREYAYQNLKSRRRCKRWDPRILDLYIKFGLRTHPGAHHLQAPYDGVSLACSRDEEVLHFQTMYREPDGATKPVQDLDKICPRIPVSIVFGSDNEYIPRAVQNALIDPASGRRFSSITRIDGAGHLVPQHAPNQLGEQIFDILSTSLTLFSKL
ncbi:Alpha/beta hydrolase fold-1 [Suillus subaureus]|uniref:Alpha/beta hydrolase fold-1 n=1 Tax=Suillus subaureus TaxID=48587 RepID=A0A9P7JED5_9AGAM|nr:Alpha/beta hydrolase fold-1 [Suillus subaureus]KAG1817522.1 Alpha/beta hydrolase fold-1 [Suillus subaureus]